MQYKLVAVSSSNMSLFVDAVNANLAEGWQPQGGVCATTHQGSGVVTFYQALVMDDAPAVGEKFTATLAEIATVRKPRQKKGVSDAG